MFNSFTDGPSVQYFKRTGRTVAASRFVPASTPLRLPVMKGVPLTVFPDTMMVPPESLKEWAEILFHIDPVTSLKWGEGTRTDRIAGDIINGVMKGIEGYASRHGLTPDEVSFTIEEGNLQIKVYAFSSGDLPIFYKDVIKRVKKSAPRMIKLVEDAFILLSHNTRTWEDVLTEAEDRFEFNWEGSEDEEAVAEKEYLELMKKQASRYSHRKKEVSAKTFGEALNKFKPRSKSEKKVAAWINNVLQLTDSGRLECIDPEQFDGYMSSWHVTPVLLSPSDSITQWYADGLNMENDSGVFLGECLFLTLGSEMHERMGLRPYIDSFLSDIRALGFRQRVFSFL